MDEQQWPEHLPDAAHARRWIASVLLGQPEVLAWHETDGGSYLLYRAFEGEVVEQAHSLDSLTATARTLAQIQAAVAIVPESDKADLPRLLVETIPSLFAEMLANIHA